MGPNGNGTTRPASRRGKPELCFAGFRLDGDGLLFSGETLVHLPPRELAALQLLLAHPGQIVSSSQLKEALWGDVHVTADSVPKCLSSLRAHLAPEDCIQTVYKRGYRFTATVRPSEPAPHSEVPRLAIPPFSVALGVPEHLGTAVAEETIVRLSNTPRPFASILARDSVFTLASQGLTAHQIGETLRADLVLAGTLRIFNFQFRLRVEMIRVTDGVQIWVEDLLIHRDRVAGLDSDLASRLDFRLQGYAKHPGGVYESGESAPLLFASSASPGRASVSVASSAGASSSRVPTAQSREAYETFLRGHHEWQSLERHRMQDGLRHITRAIELDSTLIAAKVDLANLCVTQGIYGFMSPSISAEMVRSAANSMPDFAHRARPLLPSMGWVDFHFERDLPAALQAFALCADQPHDPWITRARAMFALSRRRFAEAIALLRSAIEVDPYSPGLQARLGWALHLDGQAAESVAHMTKALDLFPDHEVTALYGSLILAFNGETARAVKVAQHLAERQPHFDMATAMHAYSLACAGRSADARNLLERMEWLSKERYVIKSFTPAVLLALGDADAALAALQVADSERCPWFFQMLADPRLHGLHERPQFKALESLLPAMEEAAEDLDSET